MNVRDLEDLLEVIKAKAQSDLDLLRAVSAEEKQIHDELDALARLADARSQVVELGDGVLFNACGEANWSLWRLDARNKLNIRLAEIRARKTIAMEDARQSSGRADVMEQLIAKLRQERVAKRDSKEFEQLFSLGILQSPGF